MVTMAIDPRVTRRKEYHVFTLVCLFYFFYASIFVVVAKLEIVAIEGGSFIEF
jgi:hypothetical protein